MNAPEWGDSRWLWSFWEMVENFRLNALRLMQFELQVLIGLGDRNQQFIEENGGYNNLDILKAPEYIETLSKAIAEVQSLTKMAEGMFASLNCVHIDHAISGLRGWANGNTTKKWSDLKSYSVALRNAMDNELKEYIYYQYPKQKGQKLKSWKTDWQTAINAFPSIEGTALSATDCYAMGHNTASVFYCMRILEYGLAALANDLGINFDIQQWQNIIDQIEKKIVEERKTLPRGVDKNERLQFLSEAAKEFFYFKDGWRNYVSHNRGNYDDQQGLSILDHTRSFMIHLANKLSEI